ncbi:polysaccharide pyruvyl transferase family protein [Vibrio splendidus]
MNKIVVLQIPNSKNNGSAMMAINSINYFDSNVKGDVEFLCDFSSSEDENRIVSELNEGTKVSTLELPTFDRGSNLLSSLMNRIKWINDVIRIIKAHKPLSIIVLGGDDFSEYYSGSKIIVRLFFMNRLSQYFPVYLIGHTIGPFTSWRKKAFETLMAKCRIITRDEPSLKHLESDLKHRHSSQGHDLAWFNLPKQTVELKSRMLQKFNLEDGKYVVITPSGLVSHYTDVDADFLNAWDDIAKLITAKGLKVVFMPHVFKNNQRDDRTVIEEISTLIGKKDNIVFINDMHLPSECRAILSGCYFSIACRMHAAVSTLQTDKPTIALSYSAKYAGVIGGDMQCPELVIEAADSNLWSRGILEEVDSKVSFIEENYSLLCEKISSRVATIQVEQDGILKQCSIQMTEKNGAPFAN